MVEILSAILLPIIGVGLVDIIGFRAVLLIVPLYPFVFLFNLISFN